MGAETEITIYALVALTCFLVSLFSSDDQWAASVAATGALMAFWSVNNALWILSAITGWALATDTLFTGLSFLLYLATRRWWTLALAALYALDVVLDHIFMTGRIGYGRWAKTENAVFIAQLLVASFPGWVGLLFLAPHARARERA